MIPYFLWDEPEDPAEEAADQPVHLPGPLPDAPLGHVEAAGGEAAEPVDEDAQEGIRDHVCRSMWNTSRSSVETGLSSGFDGISSHMCRHHLRQTSVEATAAQRSSLSSSA